MNKRIQKMEGATKEFKEALVVLAVAFLLGILVVPYAADLMGDAIDQNLNSYAASAAKTKGGEK